MSAPWRCRICEGVNTGGTTCSTCGAVALRPEPIRTRVRARVADRLARVPVPRPPALRRRPPVPLDPPPDYDVDAGYDAEYEVERPKIRVLPLPGGCLFSVGPRRRRRRR